MTSSSTKQGLALSALALSISIISHSATAQVLASRADAPAEESVLAKRVERPVGVLASRHERSVLEAVKPLVARGPKVITAEDAKKMIERRRAVESPDYVSKVAVGGEKDRKAVQEMVKAAEAGQEKPGLSGVEKLRGEMALPSVDALLKEVETASAVDESLFVSDEAVESLVKESAAALDVVKSTGPALAIESAQAQDIIAQSMTPAAPVDAAKALSIDAITGIKEKKAKAATLSEKVEAAKVEVAVSAKVEKKIAATEEKKTSAPAQIKSDAGPVKAERAYKVGVTAPETPLPEKATTATADPVTPAPVDALKQDLVQVKAELAQLRAALAEKLLKEKQAEQDRIAAEKAEAEQKAEKARVAAQEAEVARLAKEAAAAQAEQARLAKDAADKAEQERLAKEVAEKAEKDRLAKEAAQKAEQERLAKATAEKAEQERLAKEAAEKEQARLAKEAVEKAEQERLAKAAIEREQAAAAEKHNQMAAEPLVSVVVPKQVEPVSVIEPKISKPEGTVDVKVPANDLVPEKGEAVQVEQPEQLGWMDKVVSGWGKAQSVMASWAEALMTQTLPAISAFFSSLFGADDQAETILTPEDQGKQVETEMLKAMKQGPVKLSDLNDAERRAGIPDSKPDTDIAELPGQAPVEATPVVIEPVAEVKREAPPVAAPKGRKRFEDPIDNALVDKEMEKVTGLIEGMQKRPEKSSAQDRSVGVKKAEPAAAIVPPRAKAEIAGILSAPASKPRQPELVSVAKKDTTLKEATAATSEPVVQSLAVPIAYQIRAGSLKTEITALAEMWGYRYVIFEGAMKADISDCSIAQDFWVSGTSVMSMFEQLLGPYPIGITVHQPDRVIVVRALGAGNACLQ